MSSFSFGIWGQPLGHYWGITHCILLWPNTQTSGPFTCCWLSNNGCISSKYTYNCLSDRGLKWYSGLKKYFEIDNNNAVLRWYTCTHTFYSHLLTYTTLNMCWQQCCCHLSCLLSCHWYLADMAKFISANTEIKWATGNWQLIGNYATLAINNHRVF